ncbi:MAG: hypothetical protein KGD74_12080 [Candidatus Lokiarchaeota archaeon]|nr:hypothetical protein [Candidatus Lokiarchaeota archaeon]
MFWRIKIFFYLSIGLSLCGLIFPTHETHFSFDVGNLVHWAYGLHIFMPGNPGREPEFDFSLQIQGLFLVFISSYLIVELIVQMRYARLDDYRYKKNLIYTIAIIQLLASQFQLSGFRDRPLYAFIFSFSSIFALIGNKELKLFYFNVGEVNDKMELILGIVLITMSLISIVSVIRNVFPYDPEAFSLQFITEIIFGFIFFLIVLLYGLISLKRGNA